MHMHKNEYVCVCGGRVGGAVLNMFQELECFDHLTLHMKESIQHTGIGVNFIFEKKSSNFRFCTFMRHRIISSLLTHPRLHLPPTNSLIRLNLSFQPLLVVLNFFFYLILLLQNWILHR